MCGVEPDDRMRSVLARESPDVRGARGPGRVDPACLTRLRRRRARLVVVALDGPSADPATRWAACSYRAACSVPCGRGPTRRARSSPKPRPCWPSGRI